MFAVEPSSLPDIDRTFSPLFAAFREKHRLLVKKLARFRGQDELLVRSKVIPFSIFQIFTFTLGSEEAASRGTIFNKLHKLANIGPSVNIRCSLGPSVEAVTQPDRVEPIQA